MNDKDEVYSEKEDHLEDERFVEEEITYTRRRRAYTFVCSLEDCPYCHNIPQKGFHPKKKWCSDEAVAEFRRRKRAEDAIKEGRDPGVVGKPADLDQKLKNMGVFFIHSLDKLPFLYRLGYSDSWEAYEKQYLTESASKHDFDAIIIVRTPLPDSLEQKILRKFGDLKISDNLFRFEVADVRVMHQMVLEHLEAHRQ